MEGMPGLYHGERRVVHAVEHVLHLVVTRLHLPGEG
jgi:hypothetical protein